ncbi:MAG: thioredoxin family protein [Betaproteobacteria bacterium]
MRRKEGVMEIKILGPGCANCKRLYQETEKAVAQVGQPATITKVEAMEDIMAYGILRTPGLVIDEKVVASGRIPGASEIASMITTALAKA